MSTSIQSLSTFTGLSEAELARRAQDMVATGKLTGLKALDAALVQGSMSTNQGAAATMTAGGSQSAKPHVLEEPMSVLAHKPVGATGDGFATAASVAVPSLASASSAASLDKAAANGKAKATGFVEEAGASLQDSLAGASSDLDSTSRTMQFEQLKMQMQRMSEAFQMTSNVMNQTHDTSKSLIGNIRG